MNQNQDNIESKIFTCLMAGGRVEFVMTNNMELGIKFFHSHTTQNTEADLNAEADAQVALLLDSLGFTTQD